MAESAAYARRTIKGGCAVAHIPGGLNTGVTGVVACDDLSTWVGATANGSTRLMLNRAGVGPAGSTPEEIEISMLSGNNITIAARGLQGTSQANHPANSTIEVIASPRDFDEANQAVFQLLSKATTAGQRPYVSAAGVFTMLAPGTAGQIPVMNDAGTAPINVDVPPLARQKQSVRAATTAALATGTYSNGVFTVTANAALAAQDGITLIVGDRLLVKNQVTGSQNGIYTVTTVGDGSHQAVLTRATDFDLSAKVKPNAWCSVEEGTLLGGSSWRVTNTGAITLDTTALTFGLVPAVAVSKAGTLVGRRGAVNFIDGTNVTTTVADDSANDRVNVTINASGGGSGYGTLDVTQVKNSTTQSLTTATETALTFDTEDSDTSSQHDTVTNTDRITIAATGTYEISASISYAGNATGTRAVFIKNGSTYLYDSQGETAAGANAQTLVVPTFQVACTIGDIIRMDGYQSSGGNLSVNGEAQGKRATFLRVRRVA